jgi:hypothetical protein
MALRPWESVRRTTPWWVFSGFGEWQERGSEAQKRSDRRAWDKKARDSYHVGRERYKLPTPLDLVRQLSQCRFHAEGVTNRARVRHFVTESALGARTFFAQFVR